MIVTERLELVPADVAGVCAALDGREALGRCLGAFVPESWPPDYVDEPALRFTLARLRESDEQSGWWLYFVVLTRGEPVKTLVGTAGYKGPPSDDGTVEVGYSIVRDRRRLGLATEAVGGLLDHAFAEPRVERVIAETIPRLTPSIRVLRKCGFRFIGNGSGPAVIRFELTRRNLVCPTVPGA